MSKPTILLVEDNASDEALTLRALQKSNVVNEVAVVRDGPAALDYLFCKGAYADRDPEQAPHLVLLDLNLPKLSGLDVLRRIRADERTKLLPVVILTTSNQDSDLATSYALGANSYVVKPVDFQAFSEAVRQLGLYWLLVNQQPPRPHG